LTQENTDRKSIYISIQIKYVITKCTKKNIQKILEDISLAYVFNRTNNLHNIFTFNNKKPRKQM